MIGQYETIKIDLTSMRSDFETDGRWAKVIFTDNLEKDSQFFEEQWFDHDCSCRYLFSDQ